MVTPKLQTELPPEATTGIIILSFQGGPVSHEFSLGKLLDTIENYILPKDQWITKATRAEVLARYKQVHTFRQPLVIEYQVTKITTEELVCLEKAILREADLRLFNCIFSYKPGALF
jgi:hypothetical protein